MGADIQLVIATRHTILKEDFMYFLPIFICINCQTLVKDPQVQLITLHYRQLLKSRPLTKCYNHEPSMATGNRTNGPSMEQ